MTNIRVELNPLIMLAFAVLLLSIALAPLILRHHWERHYHKLCLGLAALTSYYVFAVHSGTRVLPATLEYVSFMVVVGSFFVVAGGIHLRVRGQGRPALNTLFLLGGALLGNIIGTTGASMLLIGNGPNLLVKAITEHAKIETPIFFGYAFKFAIPVLAPIFILVSILFFRI